jgi:hypothetical protein
MTMRYRTFGRMGWRVSDIGFGAWAIGGDRWGSQKDEESIAALRHALDLGVTFVDTAQGYGDGPVRVLTKIPSQPGAGLPRRMTPARSATPTRTFAREWREASAT